MNFEVRAYSGATVYWDSFSVSKVQEPAQPLLITTSVCSTATSVRLTGPWWGWDPAGGPEAADNGDGTWTFTFDPAPTDNMEYLLVANGVQENCKEAESNQRRFCAEVRASLLGVAIEDSTRSGKIDSHWGDKVNEASKYIKTLEKFVFSNNGLFYYNI